MGCACRLKRYSQLKFPYPGWSLELWVEKPQCLPFAEETEYEYSGSEEEDDSHGEEGEPRWVWRVEVGGWGLCVLSEGTAMILGFGGS